MLNAGPATRLFCVQPSYQEMDNRLRAVHGAWLSAGGPQAGRMKAAPRILQGCEASHHWDHPAQAQKASVALWDHFEPCLESFTYHLDVSARIQRQVWKAGGSAVGVPMAVWTRIDTRPPHRVP